MCSLPPPPQLEVEGLSRASPLQSHANYYYNYYDSVSELDVIVLFCQTIQAIFNYGSIERKCSSKINGEMVKFA